jgi:hypothetical protein
MPEYCKSVIPAYAGIQSVPPVLDSGVRRDDVSMQHARDIHA